jgi:hypothetical protein
VNGTGKPDDGTLFGGWYGKSNIAPPCSPFKGIGRSIYGLVLTVVAQGRSRPTLLRHRPGKVIPQAKFCSAKAKISLMTYRDAAKMSATR